MTDETMTNDERREVKGRTQEIAANTLYHEWPIDYTDGFRVTVSWSEDDKAWLAQVSGCAHDGACIADGPTKEAALLNLACSMASTLDAVEDDRAKAVALLAAAQADSRRLDAAQKMLVAQVEDESGRHGISALILELPRHVRVNGDLRAALDAARGGDNG